MGSGYSRVSFDCLSVRSYLSGCLRYKSLLLKILGIIDKKNGVYFVDSFSEIEKQKFAYFQIKIFMISNSLL